MRTKTCKQCGQNLPITEYDTYNNGPGKIRLRWVCKTCTIKRKITCPTCGKPKDKRSKQCNECFKKEPAEKKCTGCGKIFPIKAYALRPNGRGGHKRRSRCKKCEAKETRERIASLPAEERRKRRKRYHQNETAAQRKKWAIWKYARLLGLDQQAVYERYLRTKGYCDICGVHESTQHTKLHLDHCHETGVFRGFICSNCNGGLGFFRDSPKALRRAANYLRKAQSGSTVLAQSSRN